MERTDLTARATALGLALALASPAQSATIVINVVDGAGVGFNDVAAADPYAPGNPGTTIGEQRLEVFERAAQIWGAELQSPVTIVVDAQFAPLECAPDGTSAVLGSAGPQGSIFANFENAPLLDYWYAQPLANSLDGTDLDVDNSDILAQFNGDLDSGTCLNSTAGWYYGLDESAPPPDDRIPLLPVVLHELAHGLGFLSFTNLSNGDLPGSGPDERPGVWAAFQFDVETGLFWDEMSNGQRAASAINDPDLSWDGPTTNAGALDVLRPPGMLSVLAPSPAAGDYPDESASAGFGDPAPIGGITGALVATEDGAGLSSFDACEPLTNGGAVAGNIAFVDRGNCFFSVKARNVEAAGAIAMVVGNLAVPPDDGAFEMVGDYDISIPSIMVSTDLGNQIFTGGMMVTVGYDTSEPLRGTNQDLVRLFAPAVLEEGSSVSHFSTDTAPNLLMEPSINGDLFQDVDLTLPLFEDIGWNLDTGPRPDPIFRDGFED